MADPRLKRWITNALPRGYAVEEVSEDTFKIVQPPPPPLDACGFPECGLTEEDDYLTEVRVHLAPGQEGDDEMTLYYCTEHLENVQRAFMGVGFKHHTHGGIRFLSDPDCPGAGNGPGPWVCPTPGLGDQRADDDD